MASKKAKAVKENEDLYSFLRPRTPFEPSEIKSLLAEVNKDRVQALASSLSEYIAVNLTKNIRNKTGLADYRTSPYVMLASASVMGLTERERLARFLIDTKLYTGLETSFGKQVESQVVGLYPIGSKAPLAWEDPKEKLAEAESLKGLSRVEKAAKRKNSVWREIDKSCVVGSRRYLVSIKSGPNCINDTQVQAMQSAIESQYGEWLAETEKNYSGVKELDIIVGLTYGTSATTNNKENQILAKLLDSGFVEEDRNGRPGVLVDEETGRVRVYRAVGIDFWALIGNPTNPASARHTFLEVLLGVALAMSSGPARATVFDTVQLKSLELAKAILEISLSFPKQLFPKWAQDSLSDHELMWLQAAITSFFDEGI